MNTLTIRVIVDGVVRLVETGIPLSRWQSVAPTIGPIIDDLVAIGPVVILGEGDDGITHILGTWR